MKVPIYPKNIWALGVLDRRTIASQTLESITPEEGTTFAARLEALANAQDLVTLENWRRAPLALSLD